MQGVRRAWVAALQPDSLAWAMKTAAEAVTAVIGSGRSLTAVLAELRMRSLPPQAARAQAEATQVSPPAESDARAQAAPSEATAPAPTPTAQPSARPRR